MCNILRSNFEERFPEIKSAIERSVFVAIDTEFTGLYVNDTGTPSLFDDAEAVYKKKKKAASQFLISQFGLSVFEEIPGQCNRYQAHVYNFYLFPHSFGSIDCRFLCQASSLGFLCQYDFDFNKEANVRKQHEQQTLHIGMQSLELRDIDDQIISSSCNRIDEWLTTAKIGDQITLNAHSSVGQYLLLLELQKQSTMDQLRYEVEDMFKIVVTKQERTNYDAVKSQIAEQEERILMSAVGFSRIFKLLVQAKKPLVGHNMMTDLMIIYDKLYKPLPDRYRDFKADVHKLFPLVYDTKHFAFTIRKLEQLRECTFLDSTNLEELHAALSSHDAKFYVLCNPGIELAGNSQRYVDENHPHEAGYDSYLAGYAFMRLCHLYAARPLKSQISSPFPFSTYIQVTHPYANKINIGRASIPYMDLAGDDPPSVRPQWFFVESRGSKSLSGQEVANQFIRFGSVDVRIVDRRHAIVAVAYHRRVKDVLQLVKKSKRISVRLYDPIFDSAAMRTVIWSGGMLLVLSVCVGSGIILWRTLK